MTSAFPPERVNELYGKDVHDRSGDKIGTVGQVWADHRGEPTWASVKTGLFGLKESLVPLQGAQYEGDRLQVPHDRSTISDAPNVDTNDDEPLDAEAVDRLYRHYAAGDPADREEYAATADVATDIDTRSGSDTRTSDDAMTRSEERLNVSTTREQAGTARMRKYVVTEQQQVTVPVQRDEVRVEREPITDANRDDALAGPAISESEHEVTLHAERPTVQTEAVPVERVRLGTETVTDQETVGGEVRKERIDTEYPEEVRSNR